MLRVASYGKDLSEYKTERNSIQQHKVILDLVGVIISKPHELEMLFLCRNVVLPC